MTHPDRFAVERELGELFESLIAGDVQKLFAVLFVDFEPVAAALKLLAERADVFAFRVEDEDRRMIGLLGDRPRG